MEIILAESPHEGSPMADSTAATPGTSGGDQPVGHWGWNNFFQLESVIATFVATLSTMARNLRRDPFESSFRSRTDGRTALP